MGMKKKSALMMMAIMAIANDGFRQDVFKEEKTKRNKPLKKIIPKGCKEFFYGTNSVIARNKQNADKKARKRGFFI